MSRFSSRHDRRFPKENAFPVIQNSIYEEDDNFSFEIITKDDHYLTIDLTKYVEGDSEKGIIGNESLIREIFPYVEGEIKRNPKSKKAINLWIDKRVKALFNFLSEMEIETGRRLESFNDFGDFDGVLLKRHLINLGGGLRDRRKSYSAIYSMIKRIRSEGSRDLLWPSFNLPDKIEVHNDVDPRAVREVYHTCKRIIERHDQIRSRVLSMAVKESKDYDSYIANLADGCKNHIKNSILGIANESDGDLKTRSGKFSQRKHRYNLDSIKDVYSAFAPTNLEVISTILIVSMETGWIDPVFGIDLTSQWHSFRDGKDCSEKTGTVAVYATRPKTGKQVVAIGQKGARFRSFTLISRLEEKSKFLRKLLDRRLSEIRKRPEIGSSMADELEIKRRLKSPWIYFASNIGKGYKNVGISDASKLNQVLEKIKENCIKRLPKSKRADGILVASIRSLRWSDFRDAFAEHIYDNSGGNLYSLKRALDHSSVRISRHYINQRRQVKARFDAFRELVSETLKEVRQGHDIDPTILFMARNSGPVEPAEREKLLRFRTRLGMGCRDPLRPDAHLDPRHRTGALCSVQRCILCSKGVIFQDSTNSLARRYGDLLYLRNNISPQRWLTSSLSWEIDAIELVRDKMFVGRYDEFNRIALEQQARVAIGEEVVLDDLGCSGIFR